MKQEIRLPEELQGREDVYFTPRTGEAPRYVEEVEVNYVSGSGGGVMVLRLVLKGGILVASFSD